MTHRQLPRDRECWFWPKAPRGLYSSFASLIDDGHAFPDYANGMIHNALVLLSLFRFAIKPITNVADGPVVAFERCATPRWRPTGSNISGRIKWDASLGALRACARLPRGLESQLAQCSASAALSWPQAPAACERQRRTEKIREPLTSVRKPGLPYVSFHQLRTCR